jgi:hypothetical protein
MLEYLLKELEDLSYMQVVEGVKGHDWEFRDHVAEGHERRMLIHVQKQDCRHIRHALNVANIRSMHSKSF